ncbi:hypothetical protein [Streptococcus intermedius]
MSNLRQQREALENEHRYYQKRLDSIEQEYHYMKRDMMNHTDRLCNWTSHFYRDIPNHLGAATSQLWQLRDEFDMRMRRYEGQLAEESSRERKQYRKRLDDLEYHR